MVDNAKAVPRTDSTYDKLWKVRYLLDAFSRLCVELYDPHPQVSLDESMIGTKCRLFFIQHLPKKPVKWGIKVWVCADSTNGYVYTFDVYCGANSVDTSKGVAYAIVFKLLEPCLRKAYTVYMDNYYSSPLLFKDVFAAGTTATGTLRTNRKNFKQKFGDVPRGTVSFVYKGNLTVVKWSDNRDVHANSTLYSNEITKVKRQVEGESVEVSCPKIIDDYNTFMGGVSLGCATTCWEGKQ